MLEDIENVKEYCTFSIWKMVGHAKNETYELVFGNLLIGIGGFLSGLAFNNAELNYLTVSAIPIFIAGIILDVRVLRKFAFDVGNVQKSVVNLMNAINQNITDINKTKNEMEKTKQYLDSTMNELETAKDELEEVRTDIYPRTTLSDPNLLIRRFENIEDYTMFDIDKEPIFHLYQILNVENQQTDLKSMQDYKLVKLLSLLYKLVWYNNSLLHYNGTKITFEPLINLMNKKKRLNQLCRLKIFEASGEINLNFEIKMKALVGNCYNSMIDSPDLSIMMGEPDLIAKEHTVKVSEVNKMFKELFLEINDFLTVKFPEESCKSITDLEISF